MTIVGKGLFLGKPYAIIDIKGGDFDEIIVYW